MGRPRCGRRWCPLEDTLMPVETVLLDDGGVHFSADRRTSRHALPWMKLIVPTDGARVFFDGPRRGWTTDPVLTAAHVSNVSAVVGPTATFFFAPEHDDFATHDAMSSPIQVVAGRAGRAVIDCVRDLKPRDAQLGVDALVKILGAHQARRAVDGRVLEAKRQLADTPHLDATGLATRVGLSPSRLSHLFRAEMGT